MWKVVIAEVRDYYVEGVGVSCKVMGQVIHIQESKLRFLNHNENGVTIGMSEAMPT